MKVAVDATALLGHPTGVGVTVRELLRGLAARADVEVSGFALSWRGRAGLGPVLPRGVKRCRIPMAARPLRLAWSHFDWPPIELWTGAVDVVHGPNFVVPPSRRAAQVVTVHDLTFVHHPELCTADTLGYPNLIRRAIGRGAFIHAVSEFVATEVIDTFSASPDRVVVVHNGGPGSASGTGDLRRGRQMAGADRYIVAIGTVEPRKDLPTLVRAFQSMTHDRDLADLSLIIAGPDGWGSDALRAAIDGCEARARSRIHRLGWIRDDQRADLLAGAAVLAYPSVYEGFGIVPLEAMAAGVPVVATRAGAIPEIVDDAGVLVSPRDPEELAEALERVLTDGDLARRLTERGHQRASRFGWAATTEGMVDLYRRAVASGHGS